MPFDFDLGKILAAIGAFILALIGWNYKRYQTKIDELIVEVAKLVDDTPKIEESLKDMRVRIRNLEINTITENKVRVILEDKIGDVPHIKNLIQSECTPSRTVNFVGMRNFYFELVDETLIERWIGGVMNRENINAVAELGVLLAKQNQCKEWIVDLSKFVLELPLDGMDMIYNRVKVSLSIVPMLQYLPPEEPETLSVFEEFLKNMPEEFTSRVKVLKKGVV